MERIGAHSRWLAHSQIETIAADTFAQPDKDLSRGHHHTMNACSSIRPAISAKSDKAEAPLAEVAATTAMANPYGPKNHSAAAHTGTSTGPPPAIGDDEVFPVAVTATFIIFW